MTGEVFLLGPTYIVGQSKGITDFAATLAKKSGSNLITDKVAYPTPQYAIGKTVTELSKGNEVVVDAGRMPSIVDAIQQDSRITPALRTRLHIFQGPNPN